MKVTIRDRQVLKTIDPNVVEAHLQANSWHKEGVLYENTLMIWHKQDDSGEVLEIKLPVRQEFDDFPMLIGDAIKTLEIVEKRSQLDILSDLITTVANTQIEGLIIKVDREEVNQTGKVTMMGWVVGKVCKINIELGESDYNWAIKAYQDRIPVICCGDLIKEDGSFVLKNLRKFGLKPQE